MNEMIHVIPDLDRKGLREFGLVTGGIIVGLFGLAFPWLFNFAGCNPSPAQWALTEIEGMN